MNWIELIADIRCVGNDLNAKFILLDAAGQVQLNCNSINVSDSIN